MPFWYMTASPATVAGEIAEQNLARLLIFISNKAKSNEKQAHGIFQVVLRFLDGRDAFLFLCGLSELGNELLVGKNLTIDSMIHEPRKIDFLIVHFDL